MDEIHHAAIAGKLALVKSLVEDDPDLVDLEDIHARTPLMLTSSVQVAQYLLEQGTSIDQATPDGATALYYACRHGRNPDLVVLLLSKGADPCLQNRFDSTPLMMCCSQGDEKEKRGQVVGHLLRYISPQHPSSLDQKNRNGKTGMYMAAEQGLEDVIVRLLAAGADPRIEATAVKGGGAGAAAAAGGGGGGLDIDGQSAMSVKHVAQAGGHDRIVYLIEEALADSERIRLLHKARHMMDVIHATERAIAEEVDNDEDGEGAMNDRGVIEAKEEKAHERGSTKGDEETEANRIKRKVLAAVPPYLKPRITQGLELPLVQVNPAAEEIGGGKSKGDKVEEEQAKDRMLLKDVGEFVLGGQLPPELFIELMVMMRQRWYI